MSSPGALPLNPATSLRNRPATAPEGRASSGASPFASALDDALAADRSPSGSDRTAERRSTPDDRTDRAYERAADATARAADAAARAADRAAAHAARAAAKAARTADRATDRATDPTGEAPRADGAEEVTADDAAGTTPADAPLPEGDTATDAPRAGLPPALWAMTFATPLATTGPVEDATAAVAGGVPAVVVPATAIPVGDGEAPVPVAATAVPAEDGAAPLPARAAPAPATVAPPAALADLTVVAAPTAPASPAPPAAAGPAATAEVPVPVLPVAGAPGGVPAATPAVPAPAAAGTSSPATGDAPAPAAAPGAPVAAVVSAGAGGSQSSGAGNPGSGSGTPTAPAVDAAPEATPIGAGAAPAPVAATPPAATGATGEAAALPVGSQVARQVAVLGRGPDGAQTMTLVLNPENLGPVEVSVTLSKGVVDLTLRGAHEMGRAALLDGLPDLRRDLEAAGLNPSRLEVDRDTGGSWLGRHAQQQGAEPGFGQPGERGGQEPGGPRSRPWGAPADTAVSGPIPPRHRSTSSGVDVRV